MLHQISNVQPLPVIMNFTYKILLYFLFVLLALLFIGGSSIDTNTLLITGFVAALGILFALPTKEDTDN